MSFDISVNKIKTSGCHGIYEHEKVNPQKFEIDLVVSFDKNVSDEITETLNYEFLIEEIINFVQNKSFNLIETLSYNLVHHIYTFISTLGFDTPIEISITVYKPETSLNTVSENISVRYSEKFS